MTPIQAPSMLFTADGMPIDEDLRKLGGRRYWAKRLADTLPPVGIGANELDELRDAADAYAEGGSRAEFLERLASLGLDGGFHPLPPPVPTDAEIDEAEAHFAATGDRSKLWRFGLE